MVQINVLAMIPKTVAFSVWRAVDVQVQAGHLKDMQVAALRVPVGVQIEMSFDKTQKPGNDT